MIPKEDAKAFRRLLELTAAKLPDKEALQVVTFFPVWKTGTAYAINDRVNHKGTLYKCLTAHTSQADWEPGTAPSLWVRMDDPAEEWPVWHAPQGAHDAYAKGAKVSHRDKRWISTANSNVWEPGVYGWAENQE